MDYSPFPINLPVEKTPAAVITPNREQLHQIYSVANKHFDVVFDDKTAPHQITLTSASMTRLSTTQRADRAPLSTWTPYTLDRSKQRSTVLSRIPPLHVQVQSIMDPSTQTRSEIRSDGNTASHPSVPWRRRKIEICRTHRRKAMTRRISSTPLPAAIRLQQQQTSFPLNRSVDQPRLVARTLQQ